MARRVGMEVSIAAAETVALLDVDVVAAYPITPQTHIVEHLSELVADGQLDAEFVPVESEHSAMSVCVGAAAAGARTFTSTSSQGYALMVEICYIASSLRLPIVMALANRSMSAPISIWNDHADMMLARDTGWIQTVAENGQEVVDLIMHAYRVAEDHRVLLPVIVNLDGFILTHMIEPIQLPTKEEVPVGVPEVYTEAKKAQDEAIKNAKPVILEAWDEFEKIFGRKYKPIETYKAEDAEIILVTVGSISETAMRAVDRMRAHGKRVGLARIRLFRPFPVEEFVDAVRGAKLIGVVERALGFNGYTGPLCAELKSVLFDNGLNPYVWNFIAGLGGRDVTVEDFEEMAECLEVKANKNEPMGYEIVNARE